MPIKFSKACQNLNVGMNTAIEYLASLDHITQLDPNLKLSDDLYLILAEKFSKDMAQKISADKITSERQLKEQEYNTNNDDENSLHSKLHLKHGVKLQSTIKPLKSNNQSDTKSKTYRDQPLTEDEKELLNEFMRFNSINDLLLEGEYYKAPNNEYGYFKSVFYSDGKTLYYPTSNTIVNNVFIGSNELIEGIRYKFEVTLAIKNEREKYTNPHLLKSKIGNIPTIKELSAITKLLNEKKSKIDELNELLVNVEGEYESTRKENDEKIATAFNEKQKEANDLINALNEELVLTQKEININKIKLTELNQNINESNNNLIKMESIIQTLKDRVALCKNLDFISSDDEGKYLNLLTAKEYNPVNHLDFVTDFDSSFSELADHIHAYLYHEKNLIYTQYQIRNFLTLLRTNDIIVLSGLSGSGKTQIIKSFAEALGGVVKIIPVKPNWTSSDDLIGYYNPLQMSFLPTPFTEAIVEAIHNPNQLYFICLDEMNLARVEYYFADFLSKLEERNTLPEIELYANHEEELFVSEFSTLLNLVESSINGKEIKSWQEFLNNEEARIKFFEMLGNSDKESMLQLHAKMKRRLIDILKFPSTIKIPANVHFIGAINVDETTHYFSPKILDRVHIVKFDNPLLFEEQVNSYFEYKEIEKELLPVYVDPSLFSERKPFPAVNNQELAYITNKLKEINQQFLLPLNIDFGIRSIRQSLNYTLLNHDSFDVGEAFEISLNSIILQKILPRFIFDGNETAKNGKSKNDVVEELKKYLSEELGEYYFESDDLEIGKESSVYLDEMIKQSINNNSQFNFFA